MAVAVAVAWESLLAAVMLLVSTGVHCSLPPPVCPESCTCQRAPLLNCSSSGLSLVPEHIQDSVTELDLSHNAFDSVMFHRPHRNLRNVWLGNNSITRLSLCTERSLGGRAVSSGHLRQLRPRSRQRCVSWAPTLQLLSVERNQLVQLPEGLEASPSLRVLQLSFNKISTLQPGDLQHLRQLKELHLQHNLITSLHPQMFQHLTQLRVLDLRLNMLTSLHSLMYLSLRNIEADVKLDGNRWQCDCSMRSLKRRMAFDSSRGLQDWSVVCASPSILAGKELLHLEEDDLNCSGTENGPEVHQDVTVYSGSEILLSCSTQDSTWWTPSGQSSVSQPQADLLISDVSERNTGLYVCVSEEHTVVSVFNLQISRIGDARRKTRSLPRTIREVKPQDTPNRIGEERNQGATQSQLALAVCLSVFITFLIAFILGVIARPCIDVLWTKVTKKKSPAETNSVEQRQYENEAYSDGEDPEEVVTHRERRVTFSDVDYREDGNVQYYDTVATDNQESNGAVIEYEGATAEGERHTAEDSGSEKSLQQDNHREGREVSGITDAGRTKKMEFEPIPDPDELEERRSLSSSSDSSQPDKELREDQRSQRNHTIPRPLQLVEDSTQQRADSSTSRKVEVPQIAIEDRSKIPGFSSEPFADWSPHTNNANPNDSDLWPENGEQFEFSDSVQSTSARSSGAFDSFNEPKLIVVPTSDKQHRDSSSSSSSYISEGEPTQYTVNSDWEEEEDKEKSQAKSEVTNTGKPWPAKTEYSSSSSSSDSDGETQQYTFKHEEEKEEEKEKSISKYDQTSSKIVTDERDTRGKVKPMPRTKWRGLGLGVTSFGKRLDTSTSSPPATSLSSSSSENEEESTDLKVKHNKGRRGQINAPLPASDSSSSDEAINETTKHTEKQEQGEVDMTRFPFQESQTRSHDSETQWPTLNLEHTTPVKKHLDIKPSIPHSDSSSSSDNENETTSRITKQEQGEINMARLPSNAPQPVSHDSGKQWPLLDLQRATHINKHLDIKVTAPNSDSSSSCDSEDETTHPIKKQKHKETHMGRLPNTVSQTASHDSGKQWPLLDLQHTTHVKKRLDIKVKPPNSDSSSSSDSEDETSHIKKKTPGVVELAGLPFEESPKVRNDPERQWPALNLEHTPHIKRRLDVKVPSPSSDSSSSSDSEDETTHPIKKQEHEEIHMERFPNKVSQTASHDPKTQWPPLDLEQTTHIKRHQDVKVTSPKSDSSSSSDSEDETSRIKKQEQVSQTPSHDSGKQWPLLDLQHTTRVKKRLDIKVTSPNSDSSSSSDSEDERSHLKKQEHGETHMARLPNTVSQPTSHDRGKQWPLVNLQHTTHVKKRLDIKARSPQLDSASSSDSEDETSHTKKQTPGVVELAGISFNESEKVRNDPERQWPALNFEHIPHIKRRLDIKAQSPSSDSSSSSDSEDETTHPIRKQEHEEIHMERFPNKVSQTASHDPKTQWPPLDLEQTTHIKRHQDVKVTSPKSDSSSSSDSEDETSRIKKQEQVSQTPSHDSGKQWPLLDLQHTTRVKKRLDIKVTSPNSDSSSSSDSEDERSHLKKQEHGETHMARLPNTVSQPTSHDRGKQWPLVNLQHTTRVKKRLDIKGRSPQLDSASSSDSEDETSHTKKQTPGVVELAGISFNESEKVRNDPERQWPALNFEHIPHIKRRLDIKAPSPSSDSSSTSDSEDETTHPIKKQEHKEMHMGRLSNIVYQTPSHDSGKQWPLLDLQHTMRVKKRLDIKTTLPNSDSSSSSDSEDETSHIKKQEHGQIRMERLPNTVSQTPSQESGKQWPLLDLQHTTHVKKRLDIKVTSPNSDSSFSSDSEDETSHIKKQTPGVVELAGLPFEESPKVRNDPERQWPALNLEHIPHIKRRLDVKAPSPSSDSSSSSDSEDETTHPIRKQEHEEIHMARFPNTVSKTASDDSGKQWPVLDLQHTTHIKKRLDIKVTSPKSDSSSSSDSEDETSYIKKQEHGETHMARLPNTVSQSPSHESGKQWPLLDLQHKARVKKRLDIKVRSPNSDSSSSSDSENETSNIKKQTPDVVELAGLPVEESKKVRNDPERQWPALNLEHTPHIKRRLDVKAPSPSSDSSSSCDSEDETTHPIRKQEHEEIHMAKLPNTVCQTASHDPKTQWPPLDLEQTTHIKRHQDVKVTSPKSDSSSSSDCEDETSRIKKQEQVSQTPSLESGNQWLLLNLQHTTQVKKRLDIKVASPQPDVALRHVSVGSQQSGSNSSGSESEGENSDHNGKQGMGSSALSETSEKKFIRSPKTSLINIHHRPQTDHNIKLEKYSVISDDLREKETRDNIYKTPEINPELESRWATMNLGISRFRKRLEIQSCAHVPPNLPTTPPPDSPSSSSKSITVNVSSEHSLDNRPPLQRQSSSSSSSEDEIDHSVPDLSHGVPHIKRRLNIKAPSPEPNHASSSSSESDDGATKYTAKQVTHDSYLSGMADIDESQITYKRSIIKVSSLLERQTAHNAETVTVERSPSHSMGNRDMPLAASTQSMSFDETIKKRMQQSKHTTDVDVPPEIRWRGVGRNLADFPLSRLRRHQDVDLSSAQQAPPPEPEPDSFNISSTKSDDKIQGIADVTLRHEFSSISANTALDKFDNTSGNTDEIWRALSEDKRERKGLSALRAMSSERQQWEKEHGDSHQGTSPLYNDHGPQGGISRFKEDVKPLAKQQLTQLQTSSTSVGKRGVADLLYSFPSYRTHNIKLSREAPPPIPVTPPPDEAVELTWKTPQSNKAEGWEGIRAYLQHKRNKN